MGTHSKTGSPQLQHIRALSFWQVGDKESELRH